MQSSDRDYVNVRHWKKQDGILLCAGCPTTHPDRPTVKKVVRGEAKVSGMALCPVEGDPERTLLRWLFHVNIGVRPARQSLL